MYTIHEEMIAFFAALNTGIVIRMCYCCITCFRGIVKHNNFAIEIEDVVFWAGSAIYTFVQIYYTSSGVVRWNFTLGIVIGAWISSLFLKGWKKVRKKIYNFHASKNIAKKSKKRYDNKY